MTTGDQPTPDQFPIEDDVDLDLAAHALDALDDLEAARVERLVASDPNAAHHLRRYNDAIAAYVGVENAQQPPPEAWDAIATTIRSRRASTPGVTPPRGSTGSRSLPASTKPGSTRRTAMVLVPLAAAAAIVAVVVSVMALRGNGNDLYGDMQAAMSRPDSRAAALFGTVPDAVLTDDGTGYVLLDDAATLSGDQVYQLWTLDSGTPVSIGVLHPEGDHRVATFDAPTGTRLVAVTVEPAPGGASAPSSSPVAQAELH